MTKVLAFNSSPNMERGGTSVVLTPFLQGMGKAGADVELVYNYQLNVQPCRGDFQCWTKTPGRCFQQDDMEALYPKIADADILVFGTPVYVDGMTGLLKIMLDRIIPLGEPFFELRDDHCRHPRRDGVKRSKVALVSVCGFHELDNFAPLVSHMKAICKNMDADFEGAIVRPHVGAFAQLRETEAAQDILHALTAAGTELVRDGHMSMTTLETISRELVTREEYADSTNRNFQMAIDFWNNKQYS